MNVKIFSVNMETLFDIAPADVMLTKNSFKGHMRMFFPAVWRGLT